MNQKLLLGISISLLAAMLITSCGDTQTASKEESSVPVSSAAMESVVPSDVVSDETSSQEVSSAAASSSKVNSSKMTSSKVTSSKVASSKLTSSDTVSSTASQFVPQPKNPATLSKEQENQIKADWVSTYMNPEPQHTVDQVKLRYLGTYNGYVVLTISDNFYSYPAEVQDVEIDGVVFRNWRNGGIQVWSDGKFFGLKAAYEKKWLTQTNLKDIAYYYYHERPYSEYTPEEFEKLDIEDNRVVCSIKSKFNDKEFILSDFPEVDGIEIEVYDWSAAGLNTRVCIILREHSKQGVLEAIKRLEKNQYVARANPDMIVYPD